MVVESLQFIPYERRKRRLPFREIALFAQDVQQMGQCRPNRMYTALTRFRTPAHRKVPDHEPVHQALIETLEFDLSGGHPAGKMFDAVKVGANGSRAILMTPQIANVSIYTPPQNTGSEALTIRRNKQALLL